VEALLEGHAGRNGKSVEKEVASGGIHEGVFLLILTKFSKL
jgi:hypothetical protein